MDDLIQCKHTGQRGRDNECFDCGKRVVSTANATSGGTHRHDCPCCRVKWLCSNGCTSKSGTVPIYRVCSACYTEEDTNSKELELKHEFDRFALLIDAIRDLLRWIDVVRVLDAYHMHTVCFIGDIPNPAELMDVHARAAARGLLPVELTQAELDRVTQAKELERIFSAIEGHLELFEALGEE